MREDECIEAAIIAAGVAEVALSLHLEFDSVKEKRYNLAEVLVKFGRVYCQHLSGRDCGVEIDTYITR